MNWLPETEPLIAHRTIIEHGVEYGADYTTNGLWRAASTEKGDYHGGVREIEGKLFSANASKSDKGEGYQHLVWTAIRTQ